MLEKIQYFKIYLWLIFPYLVWYCSLTISLLDQSKLAPLCYFTLYSNASRTYSNNVLMEEKQYSLYIYKYKVYSIYISYILAVHHKFYCTIWIVYKDFILQDQCLLSIILQNYYASSDKFTTVRDHQAFLKNYITQN